MAFTSDDLGAVNDTVVLKLNGEDVLIAESYEVKMGWLTQPGAFSIRLGWGGTAGDLAEKYPPNTPFELYIAGALQFTGRTDGYMLRRDTGATEVTIRGRDDLAPLHDARSTVERSFDNDTYHDLVLKALDAANVTDFTLIDESDPTRNRRSNVDIPTTRKVFGRSIGKRKAKAQIKLGDSWYSFLKQELDRAGLFLFADKNNTFVIAEPRTDLPAVARILNRRGLTRNLVNVVQADHRFETTHRFSECVVTGRGGNGGKLGQPSATGRYVDNEMTQIGYNRPLAIRQDKVSSNEQAAFVARRRIAESRREDWQLNYVVSGHTIPSLIANKRAVWAVDTVVEVVDDEFYLYGKYWVESVTFRRNPSTTTEINLMRVEDVVFSQGQS